MDYFNLLIQIINQFFSSKNPNKNDEKIKPENEMLYEDNLSDGLVQNSGQDEFLSGASNFTENSAENFVENIPQNVPGVFQNPVENITEKAQIEPAVLDLMPENEEIVVNKPDFIPDRDKKQKSKEISFSALHSNNSIRSQIARFYGSGSKEELKNDGVRENTPPAGEKTGASNEGIRTENAGITINFNGDFYLSEKTDIDEFGRILSESLENARRNRGIAS